MLLLETDGKRLFREAGIAVPRGVRCRTAQGDVELPGNGPWLAKAQVPVGGRGKAGGIRVVTGRAGLSAVLSTLLGATIKTCVTDEVLVEEHVDGEEHYLSIMVDAGAGGVRLMYLDHGGVDVEAHSVDHAEAFNEVLPLDRASLEAAVSRMAERAPASRRAALNEVALRLTHLFLDRQLLLAEINPLFARRNGAFVAGDAKVVIDMNVAARGDHVLKALIEDRKEVYPDAWRKLSEDFDFVEVDANGQVGLITTGAGLSMMLIDELVGRGLAPFNFCDMRTGQMRGSPARLLRILDWLGEARDVRVVLVNIFAGITDLAEFTQLLVDALHARPQFKRPIVARLVGNGEAAAQRIIAAHPDLRVVLEPDLERAIARTAQHLEASPTSARDTGDAA